MELFVASDGVAYMVRLGSPEVEVPEKLFYPKKLDPLVINKLSLNILARNRFGGGGTTGVVERQQYFEGLLGGR